jgi:hypothetical protein
VGRLRPGEARDWLIQHAEYEDPLASGANGGMLPYTPNKAHELLWETRAAELGPSVLVPYKSRQVAVSSWCLDLTIAASVLRDGTSAAWFAPKVALPKIRAKFNRIVKPLTGAPDARRITDAMKVPNAETGWPGLDSHRDEMIVLANGSRISWTEAGDTKLKSSNAGISETLHLAVFSEFGHWKYGEEAWASVFPAVERARGTLLLDTTPPDTSDKGAKYLEIAHRALRGDNPLDEPIVLPWWLVDSYRLTRPATDLTDEEMDLMARHGLDVYQIAWRRTKIGSRKFTKHYLEDPVESLLPVEDLAFDPDIVKELMTRQAERRFAAPLPPETLRRVIPERLRSPHLLEPRWDGDRPARDEEYGDGYVRIWAPPVTTLEHDEDPTYVYRLAVDPAQGIKGGDPIALVVTDPPGRTVATAKLWLDPTPAASVIQALAEWYGADVIGEDSSVWSSIRLALESEVPERETRRLDAHTAVREPFDGHVREQKKQRRDDRTGASREYINGGRPLPDPDFVVEVTGRDPRTGKHRDKNGPDDLLDALGIAAHDRIESAYTPTASSGWEFGERAPRKSRY